MLKLFLTAFFSLFLAAGCGPRYVDYFPYHDDGTRKPYIVLLPLADCAGVRLPWNFTEEFMSDACYEIMNNGNLFLVSPQEVDQELAVSGNVDFFGPDLSYCQNFKNADFVVATEMIEHKVVPYEKTITPLYQGQYFLCRDVLMTKLRVRIIDVRCSEPRIIHQEIIQCNHRIPRDCPNNFNENVCWGEGKYPYTPYGAAHHRLISDFVDRLESVTWNAR